MRKSQLPSDRRVYYTLGVLFVVLLLIMPRSGKFNYDYRKGSPWAYETLVSQFDFPILKTAEQIQAEREAAGSSVIPYFKYSEEVAADVKKRAEALPMGSAAELRPRIVSAISSAYARGVMADSDNPAAEGSHSSGVILVQKGKRASKTPVDEVLTVSQARARITAEVSRYWRGSNTDSLLAAGGVFDLLQPNLRYDKESTELVHVQSADNISPTNGFVSAGQVIVSKGEIVTAEIQQLLDSYKAEYEDSLGYNGPKLAQWAGNALIALILVLILFLSIFYTNRQIFADRNRYLFLAFVFTLNAVVAFVLEKLAPSLLYMAPFTVSALYLLAFFKKRVVLPVYIISLLPLLIFCHNGTELFVMFLAAGVVTIYVFDWFNKGWRQFVTALISFFVLVVAYFGFRLIGDFQGGEAVKVFYLFIGSLLTVAFYPFVYLFEKIFMLVSSSRLQELCDTNGRLLTTLSQKAPGTFQHSLQVMNMADAVARRIHANSLLVRAGALYHDIGKTGNPLCFIENQAPGAVSWHEGKTPKESAKEIIRHVSYGMELARQNNLPSIVSDFIRTHHGTATVSFFYNKYVNEGGDPADVADFTYDGVRPTTKEQVILMICDSVEAASRTLKDNSPETFDKFVEDMVRSKIDGGQLADADISLRELGEVKAELKDYLAQLYHGRIAYPERDR